MTVELTGRTKPTIAVATCRRVRPLGPAAHVAADAPALGAWSHPRGRVVAQTMTTERGAPCDARFAPTKFRPMTLPGTLVTRSALHERLTDGAGKRLTVVVGSAGAGRSVLLSSWSQVRAPDVTSWLSCDGADADPVRF